jgi:signal peptidase II
LIPLIIICVILAIQLVRRQRSIYSLIIFCVVLADLQVKQTVAMHFAGARGMSLRLIPGFFHIVYVENTGAAFSMLQGKRIFLILFSAVMLSALIAYMFLKRKSAPHVLLVGLSLVVGGGLGNLSDRVRLGYVVDYIEFQLFSFPVFNIADIAVCAGCGLLLLHCAIAELRARGAAGRKASDGPAE